MPQRLSKIHVEAWGSFLTAHAMAIERIEKALAQAQCMPLTWYDILLVLSRAPEQRLRMHELAQKVSKKPHAWQSVVPSGESWRCKSSTRCFA